MTERLSNTNSITDAALSSISNLLDDQEKLHATLEERIYTIVGNELLNEEYRPTAYAEAVMMSAGDVNYIIYNYAKIRYNELYSTASRRLKHTSELKGGGH